MQRLIPIATCSFFIALFCAPLIALAQHSAPTWQEPPRLVVGVVVDQMRTDYIYRYWDNFGEGGFKRLLRDGSFQRDAHYNYAPTHTGPGHASIYTGTTPRDHGVILNDMFDRTTGLMVNCVQDNNVQGVEVDGPRSQRSPLNLLSSTIADELERRFDGRSKTVGVSFKDRGAILPMGRTGDAAYWYFEDAKGSFATSTWYGNALPQWLRDFNARGLVAKELNGTWDLLLPRERYHQVLPDLNPYEHALPGATEPTLPLNIKEAYAASNNSPWLIKNLPAALAITTELALAALDGEQMGRDAITDLLAVSYSATDELGHTMGIRALEIEDMYLRLDRELERLLKELDKRVGADRYTLFLTADHAAVDVPEYLKDLKGSAGYVEMSDLMAAVESALSARFGDGKWIRRRVKDQLYLNDSLLTARKMDRTVVQAAAADVVRGFPGIAEVFTAAELVGTAQASDRAVMVQRGFMQQRSGDVCFLLRPGYLPAWPGMARKGTEHGSPWTYDTHIPVIFFGKGVRQGEVTRRTAITDIAPTVCTIVGMALPDACTGTVVGEVLAPADR
ncbi:MAG: alkaline phosphatase family protein [Flavobacteriales bacterium]|nr:alkaline phosphatase family protein [Flavobacteriales bacterium]